MRMVFADWLEQTAQTDKAEVVRLLAEGPGGDYGVHSEMFTTGLMHLHEAGKVTIGFGGS